MTATAYTRALGVRLLSEANDIKRTAESLAAEMGLPATHIEAAIDGRLAPEEYRTLFEGVSRRYPIAFGRLWIEPEDAKAGVVHMTAAESVMSRRVFARADRTGTLTPYYEYRDTAASRTGPFRPEWIRQLRAVEDADPLNPDVAYNKGHFLHQTTLFLGAVNFYWEVDGQRYGAAMNTGDSNYITPFWPHSFARRAQGESATIIAVTYGGEVARARDELHAIGGEALPSLTLDLRREAAAYGALLRRHLAHEMMTEPRFVDRCGERGMDPHRVAGVFAERVVPGTAELAIMADVLSVTPRDLMPPLRTAADEVVVLRRAEAETYPYPSAAAPCWEVTRLARSRQQRDLKSFLVRVLPGTRAPELAVPLHQFVYNHGEAPVALLARAGHEERVVDLAPDDSAYIAPMTACRFGCEGSRPGALYLVRVPGELHQDAVFEISSMPRHALGRASSETTRWF